MTLNVLAHQEDILSAYDVVLKSPGFDNWVILEYEKNSNIIKVADTGDGGMEELSRNFAAGRLQYGVGAVKWGASGSAKIVLIQWQGEGVPSSRLVTTANHGTELKRFLRGVHVILTARSEEDVDMESVLRVVSRLPGVSESVPTLRENSDFTYQETIGTTCHAVKSKNEIDTNSRDFWKEVRVQEIDRTAKERRREQEKSEMAFRERNELGNRIRAHLLSEEGIKKADEPSNEKRQNDLVQIKKALFEKLSHKPQQHSIKNVEQAERTTRKQASECISISEDSVHIIEENGQAIKSQENANEQDVEVNNIVYETNKISTCEDILEKAKSEVTPVVEDEKLSHGACVIALWDYQAADETEISFNPNDIITEVDQIDEGWWRGRAPDGHYGLFPANYVSLL
ncbi:unnamed protein product [Litomosoides sigmodontis]|uniref:SH3 domain-containing protein n=1 Tax=Litomosoides sigmodontis TaxID=42156 RepID=A0A3P6SH69_LITSI|nr:unnamed protein product [Litomosoides sigmodontis]